MSQSKPALPNTKYFFNQSKLSEVILHTLNVSRLPITIKETGVVDNCLFNQMIDFAPRDLMQIFYIFID